MNKLWLDLELREDIDDYVTLIFALERKMNIDVVSIHNPSKNELTLLKSTLNKFGVSIPIIITGEKSVEYPVGKDLNPYFEENDLLNDVDYAPVFKIEDFIESYDIKNTTVFCGGSLKTLSILVDKFDVEDFNACVQGGFASYLLVGEDKTLKKFKGREAVPTWNLNLDINATEKVLSSGLSINFVSKNICHSSFVSAREVKDSTSALGEFLRGYFRKNKKKLMHDVLAFMSISTDIVKFKEVRLLRTDDERPKWWSESDPGSRIKISIDYNYESFISELF